MMIVTRRSAFSGVTRTRQLDINPEEYARWIIDRTVLIQEAFPHLSRDDCEFLITGITSEEWNEMCPEDEEE